MANQAVIEKLKAKIKKFEDMMVTLKDLFKSDDGVIDAEEQKELDLVQSYIDKVKKKLKMTTDGGSDTQPTSYSINESVGKGGKNNRDDVKVIQILLKKNAGHNLVPDGLIGKKTITAIEMFQKSIFNGWSDGLISPGKQTFKALAKGSGTSDDTNSGTGSQDDDSSGSSDDSSTTDDSSSGDLPAALGTKSKISASVGQGGKNKPEDVVIVKQILKEFKMKVDPSNSEVGSNLIAAIKKFQKDYVGSSKPDGRVDAGGRTWSKMLGLGRLQGGMDKIASKYGVEPAVIMAIQSVEAGGNGFFSDGRPRILFEGHVFWKQLKSVGIDPAKHHRTQPNICYPKWDKKQYKGGTAEYDRLEKAKKIHKIAALKSASWGEFQIMGFNHKTVGYGDVESFVEAMKQPGSNQLGAVMEFVKQNKLLRHVQGSSKNWAAFARGYNGPGYAKNQYDKKLAAAYARFSKIG